MKIAVFHNLPPGGQKRVLYEQVKRLAQNHRLDLFTFSETDESYLPLGKFVGGHRKVFYHQGKHFPGSLLSVYFRLFQASKELAEMINNERYDAVLVAPCYYTQAPYILRYLAIPSLYYCPEPRREFYEKIPRKSNFLTYNLTYPFRLPLKKIDQVNTKCAQLVVTNSKYSQKRLNSIYNVKSVVNYPGVDTKLFHYLPIEKENIVLAVGNFSLLKGHDFIIRSLAKIDKKIRPKLIIIGQPGVEKEYLVRMARDNRIDLILEENISEEKLLSWYNRAKIFLNASLSEPFGMVLLEAAACGLPVLCVNEGGVGEVITSKLIGELVKRNERQFAQKIKYYLERKSDKKDIVRRHEYMKKHWNWEKSVGELEKMLQKIAI